MTSELAWGPAAAALRDLGDLHVFGLPLDAPGLLDACTREERSVFSDERTAAFAAFGRATLQPDALTVLSLETGPSFVNALLGLSEAASGRVPLLVVVEAAAPERRGWGAFQDLPIEDICRSLKMPTRTIENSADLIAGITAASRQAFRHRSPAVAVVRTRTGSDEEHGDGTRRRWSRDRSVSIPATRESMSALRAVDELRDAAAQRARIAVIVGGGAKRAHVRGGDLDAFAAQLGASTLVTASGRGAIDESSESFVGLAGLYATPEGLDALAAADVVVSLGSALEETVRERWAPKQGATLLLVDESEVSCPAHDGRRIDVTSDAAAFLALARDGLVASAAPPPLRGARPIRQQGVSEMAATWAQIEGIMVDGHFDIVCIENGLTDMWGYDPRFLTVPPSTSLVVAAEQAAMGAALCGSLGAKRSQKALVICGDATLRMHLAAVTDAVENHRPIAYVVSSNSGMGWPSLSRTDPELTTFAWNRRLPAVLSSLGVDVITPAELRSQKHLSAPAATFFDVHPAAPPWES
ncbi:thiamine pyrophosphate-binding protein [Microbacterium sp. SGAir0570]|uniref:thiamine pyrophosphate-binding protein n=1 Tax=Microbacterium sp. SGAir0570 TaxID=2070348 RepID=UPI0015E830DD|nr:thiamine pyrophosphate-binding protein [Microbacterium sp. SGAir0570]